MWNEVFYLFGLQAEATVGLWTGNLSAGSDKVAPTPDKRAVDHHNISLQFTQPIFIFTLLLNFTRWR